MTVGEALIYLSERAPAVAATDSSRRPRWSVADVEAVMRLIERPASSEQIALARIEGRASELNGYVNVESIRAIRNLARSALGLGPSG